MPGTPCAKALQIWSEKNEGAAPEDAEVVKLMALTPPIEKMDASLNSLVSVRHLSLGTNSIDKMIALPALKNLQVLSLGRNQIKKIAGLDEVGQSLQELWMSYNQISSLDGLHPCVKLRTLYISNNKLKSFDELSKVAQLPELKVLCLIGNPMYEGLGHRKEAQPHVLSRLPAVANLDGEALAGDDA